MCFYKYLEIVADFHIEATCSAAVALGPAVTEVTDTTIPATEIQTHHRIHQNRAVISVLRIKLVADIEGEERVQTPQSTGKLRAAENRNKGSHIEIPLLRDTDAHSERDVGMYLTLYTTLNIKGCEMITCLNGLKLKKRVDRRCRQSCCAECD